MCYCGALYDALTPFQTVREKRKGASDVRWLNTVLTSGTLSDKVAARTLLVQVSSLCHGCNVLYVHMYTSLVFSRTHQNLVHPPPSLPPFFPACLDPSLPPSLPTYLPACLPVPTFRSLQCTLCHRWTGYWLWWPREEEEAVL